MLAPTPPHALSDAQGRPYFAWDEDIDLAEFLARLRDDPDHDVRDYTLGKLLRQAKPDDVLTFVSPQEIADAWTRAAPYVGQRRAFWEWLLETWERLGRVHR